MEIAGGHNNGNCRWNKGVGVVGGSYGQERQAAVVRGNRGQ